MGVLFHQLGIVRREAMPRKTVIRVESGKPVSPIGSRRVQKEDQWGGYVQCEVGVTERASFDEFCAGGNRCSKSVGN